MPLGPHAHQTRHEQRIGQIAIGLLVVFTDEAAITAARLRHLSLGHDFIDDACHVGPGGRILCAGEIANADDDGYPGVSSSDNSTSCLAPQGWTSRTAHPSSRPSHSCV